MVLYFDAYSLGDPLFATALGRDVKARGAGLVLVHGSGEAGERALEAAGAWPSADSGVWRVSTDAEADAVERAVRDLNRRLSHEINEAGAAVVGVVGRGLLRVDPSVGSGTAAGRTDWLADLVGKGATAVVASMASSPGGGGLLGAGLRETDAAAASAALARALGTFVGVLVTGRGSTLGADRLSADDAVASGRLADAAGVRRIVASGVAVRAVALPAVRTPGVPEGTWIGDATVTPP
jgi:hypothetical protein